jgi:hypothetical protein
MPSGIPSSEVSAVVLAAFERAPGPLTLAALKKAMTKPFQAQGSLREAVSGLMAEGRIHRWPGTAKSEKYWVHEPGVFTRGKIIEALRPGAAVGFGDCQGVEGIGPHYQGARRTPEGAGWERPGVPSSAAEGFNAALCLTAAATARAFQEDAQGVPGGIPRPRQARLPKRPTRRRGAPATRRNKRPRAKR